MNEFQYTETDPKVIVEFLRARKTSIKKLVVSSEFIKEHKNDLQQVSYVEGAKSQAEITLQTRNEEELKSKEPQNTLLLDHIQDTQNLGAIARSCAFFGVERIIVPADRQTIFSSGAVKSSRGGFAYVDIFRVKNISRSLTNLKKKGYWIVGTDMSDASSYQNIPIQKLDLSPVVLIMGSEGKGISPNILKACDQLVHIPAANKLDSLNVSVAAGICLHHLCMSAQSK